MLRFLLLRILVLAEYEGNAIMIRGHGGGGGWVWSTEVIDVAGPILTETVRKLFARQEGGVPAADARSAFGTNLTDISDWSREWCFVDAFKASRAWIEKNPLCGAHMGKSSKMHSCHNLHIEAGKTFSDDYHLIA